jgi:hypothetical protein
VSERKREKKIYGIAYLYLQKVFLTEIVDVSVK